MIKTRKNIIVAICSLFVLGTHFCCAATGETDGNSPRRRSSVRTPVPAPTADDVEMQADADPNEIPVVFPSRCSRLNNFYKCFCKPKIVAPLFVLTVLGSAATILWYHYTNPETIEIPPIDKVCINFLKDYGSKPISELLYMNKDKIPDLIAYYFPYFDPEIPGIKKIDGALCAQLIKESKYSLENMEEQFRLHFNGFSWACKKLTSSIFGCTG